MASSTPSTIIVQGDRGRIQDVTLTAATLTPGSQVYLTSASTYAIAAAQTADPTFAVEGLVGDIDTDYAASASARVYTFQSGEKGYVRCNAAVGGAIAIGDLLESEGNGYLAKYAAGSVGADSQAVAVAEQALASGNGRIVVRFL